MASSPVVESMTTSIAPTTRGKAFASSLPVLQPYHKRLFLLRHGQTDWNKSGLMQGGGFDIPLNNNGKEQANQVSNELSAIPLGVIASSHLQRAIQTANALQQHNTDTTATIRIPRRIVDHRFGEMRFGTYEGKAIHGPQADAQTVANFQAMLTAMKEDIYLSWPGEDAENTFQVSTRGAAGMESLLDRYDDENHFAVVAHGRFNKVLLATLLWNDPSRYVEIEQSNTCINVLDYNQKDEFWNPVLINYADHAPNADAKKELKQQQQQQAEESFQEEPSQQNL